MKIYDASLPLVVENDFNSAMKDIAKELRESYKDENRTKKSEVMRRLLDIAIQLRRSPISLVDVLLMSPDPSVARGEKRLRKIFGGAEFRELIGIRQMENPLETLTTKELKRGDDITRIGMRLLSSQLKWLKGATEGINRRRNDNGKKELGVSEVVRSLMNFSLPLLSSDMTLMKALEDGGFHDEVVDNREFLDLLFGDVELRYFITKSLGVEAEKM